MKCTSALAMAAGGLLVFGTFLLPAAAQNGPAPTPAVAPASPPTTTAAPKAKIVVKSKDDLPRHTYHIAGKTAEFLASDGAFKAFAGEVKKDAQSDLDAYLIEDRTTLQEYYSLLQNLAVFERDYAAAKGYIAKVRELEQKQSKKLTTGIILESLFNAEQKAGAEAARSASAEYLTAFRDELDARVRGLPWAEVREDIIQARGRAEFLSRDLILGSVSGALDPVLQQSKGEISNEVAWPLVGTRVALDRILPLQPTVADVYSKIIDEKEAKGATEDLWTPTLVELKPDEKASPVVAAIWDSGVDVSLFDRQLFINPREKVNGKDDDGNGFIDDVNGIAFDLYSERTPELLVSLKDLRSGEGEIRKYTKGFSDLNNNVRSDASNEVVKHLQSLKKDAVTPFLEDLQLYGNHSHGTHVAGIASAGNPFVRLLPVRITFDFRTIPTITPSVVQAQKEAAATSAAVAYMKSAGVRVVNMSWGGSRADIETALEQKGVGKDPAERAALSREIFNIGKVALQEAIQSAPEILFVAAAGNSDNDNEFSEMIPSGLNAPNLLTVGAVDQGGKPTGFTSFGKNVVLYANGFEVDSFVPGGERMKFSGTSMAAPQVTNLVAKMLAVNPKLTTAQVLEMLKAGAVALSGHEGRFIVNPAKSIELARKAR